MKTVCFEYWTDLMYCGCGGNVGGNALVELEENDFKVFKSILETAKEGRDMLAYFKENLSPELSERLCSCITDSFKRKMAEDAICQVGIEAFFDITEEEYENMSPSERTERLVSETDFGNLDFKIVDIEIQY